jgi:predicted RNA-binding protein Jag
MESNERRVIHLSLAEEQDLVTESIGEITGDACESLKATAAQ